MATEMTNKLFLFRSQFGVQESFREPATTFVDNNQGLAEFLSQVEGLLNDIKQIHEMTLKIDRNHGTILASFDNNAAKQENIRLMENVKTLSKKVHKAMKEMKQVLDLTKEEMQTPSFRVKKAQYITLSHQFTETMAEYNSMQEMYQEKNKEQIRRQIQLSEFADKAGKAITETELESLLESNDLTKPLLGTDAQKSALNEVEARQKEILLLEQNILELRDMFYDIAVLVDEQGETVDRISDQVEQAATFVQAGRVELQQAVVYQQSNRRLRLCIALIVLGVVLGIVAVLIIIIVPVAVTQK